MEPDAYKSNAFHDILLIPGFPTGLRSRENPAVQPQNGTFHLKLLSTFISSRGQKGTLGFQEGFSPFKGIYFIPNPTAIGNFVNFFKIFISVPSFVFDL